VYCESLVINDFLEQHRRFNPGNSPKHAERTPGRPAGKFRMFTSRFVSDTGFAVTIRTYFNAAGKATKTILS